MSSPAPPDPSGDPAIHGDPRTYHRRWHILAVLCLSLLIVSIGNSSLNVAVPTLARDLHATNSQLQWVIAIYSLIFAGLLFTTGAIGDRFGRKGALQAGLGIYTIACLAATQSHTIDQLIVCRGVMGLGAALIMPSTLSILVNVFPPQERTKAIAVWASVTGVSGILGPIASGLLIEHFWYGSVFLTNVPTLIIALVAGWYLIPKSKDPTQGKLDPVGAVLSIAGVASLVYALIAAPERGWGAPSTLTWFAVGGAVLAVFVVWELHHDEPMLDIRLFRDPAFSTGTGGMILGFLALYGAMFLTMQYFQMVLGYSAIGTALRFGPTAPIMIIVSPLTPRLAARFGSNRVVGAGLLLLGIGLSMFHGIGMHTPYAYVLASFIPILGGLALMLSPMTAAIMSAVPPERAGTGSAMNDTTRELGAALGIAVMGSLAASRYASKLGPATDVLPAGIRQRATSSLADALSAAADLPSEAAARLTQAAREAYISGIHLAVVVSAALSFVAAAAVLRYLPRDVHHGADGHPGREAAEITAELGIGGVMPAFDVEPAPTAR